MDHPTRRPARPSPDARRNRQRRGSILILVVALVVLLALIGTAYLSSTQVDRYTAAQSTINTQDDLQMQGLMAAVDASVNAGLYGTTTAGSTFRPPSQEMPTYDGTGQYTLDANDNLALASMTPAPGSPAYAGPTGYNNYDSPATDLFLGARVPTQMFPMPVFSQVTPSVNPPCWVSGSFPPFTSSVAGYVSGVPMYPDAIAGVTGVPPTYSLPAAYKPYLQVYPTSTTVNGQTVPGAVLYLSAIPAAYAANTQGFPTTTGCLKITGGAPDTASPATVLASPVTYPADIFPAADTDGDGITDAALFPLPGGPVNGITYYGAYRTTDGNSAVNVSSAWTSTYEYSATTGATTVGADTLLNFGFFRSGVGLQELLGNTSAAYAPANKLVSLNQVRFNYGSLYPLTPTYDTGVTVASTEFGFYTIGEAMEHQLARRPGNPGYTGYTSGSGATKFQWSGPAVSAVLAHRFTLQDASRSPSPVEQALTDDLLAQNYNPSTSTTTFPNALVPVMPFAPGNVSGWFGDQFNFTAPTGAAAATTSVLQPPTLAVPLGPPTPVNPLRSLLTGTSGVSNAVPSRLGNASGPPTWVSGTSYQFGDWVTDGGRSYVCILPHTAAAAYEPGGGTTPGVYPSAAPYWAGTQALANANVTPGLPFTRQPVKVSANTAPFEQLWLAFCQVMCDSIGSDPSIAGALGTPGFGVAPQPTTVKQWQPPMQYVAATTTLATGTELQLPMFRSVTRDPTGGTANRLTASQMLKVRAAIAAVNTVDLRDSDDDVTSRRIILMDETVSPPVAKYDVEVFGTEAQPFIGAVYAHIDTATPSNNFLAIQFLNPYDHPITVDPAAGWALGQVVRSSFPTLTMKNVTTLGVNWTSSFTIPAKSRTTGLPGVAVIQSAPEGPTGYVTPTQSSGSAGTGSGTTATPPVPPTATPLTITGLQLLLTSATGEIYLMKPRLQQNTGVTGGIATAATSLTSSRAAATGIYGETYTETSDISELVPVDQVDLTNLNALATATPNATTGTADFYYRRGSDPTTTIADTTTGKLTGGRAGWNFVYPGQYVPPTVAAPYAMQLPQGFGTDFSSDNASPAKTKPSLGMVYGYTTADPPDRTGTAAAGVGNPTPTFVTFPIVLNNTYMGGPARLQPQVAVGGPYTGSVPFYPAQKQWPFGGFARNADLLQVPYIGAYRIRIISTSTGLPATPNTFLEMNSVSEDSSLANDTTLLPAAALTTPQAVPYTYQSNPTDLVTSPHKEQIGRFCPIGDPGSTVVATALDYGDVVPGQPVAALPQQQWHYHWAKRLFDYLTVQAPNDDYFPSIEPAPQDTGITAANGTETIPPNKYSPLTAEPVAVANTTPAIANNATAYNSEDTAGVEGLININTAPWPILATLPFFTNEQATVADTFTYTPTSAAGVIGTYAMVANQVDDRVDLAKAIVDFRNVYGPFKSIQDLYRVPLFRAINNSLIVTTEPLYQQGVFAPNGFGGTSVGVVTGRARYDFQDRFLLLNQVSNLITTRSDTFTCYALVQGYRNVGVTGVTPTLVVQRRQAYLIDRNGVTPANRQPAHYPVPTN